MVKCGASTPQERWASLVQVTFDDAATKNAAASGDRADDQVVDDLIAKAASEVERHGDTALALRVRLQAMHAAAAEFRHADGGAQEHEPSVATAGAARSVSEGSTGLDIRR